jgi:hypothetical protein
MLQSIDHHYLRLAGRFERSEALDPAAMHRRELARMLRQERRARWLARRLRLRDWIISWSLQQRKTAQVELEVKRCRSC